MRGIAVGAVPRRRPVIRRAQFPVASDHTWGEEPSMVFDVALREGFVLLNVAAPDPHCVRLAPSVAVDLAMRLLAAAMDADETGKEVSSSDFNPSPFEDTAGDTDRLPASVWSSPTLKL